LKGALNRALDRRDSKKYRLRYAEAGDGAGTVQVPGRPEYIYVRIQGIKTVVYNDRIGDAYDNQMLMVGYDDVNPDLFQVLDTRKHEGVDLSGYYGRVSRHHWRHEYGNLQGGDDVVYSDIRQIMPLRVGAGTGISVYFWPGMILDYDGWSLGGMPYSLSLLSYQPTTAGYACWVLIGWDEHEGKLYYLKSAEKDSVSALYHSDIPIPPTNIEPLAAIRLYQGQTVIDDAGGYMSDIVDLRLAVKPGATNPGHKILAEGVAQNQRGRLNITGTNVTVTPTDSKGQDRTTINLAVTAAHAAVTLDADADKLLSLSGQEIGFDTKAANQILAGPTTGAADEPDFRALVAADIGTGAPSGAKFLRDDLVWTAPAGGGDVLGPAGATDGHAAVFDGATGKLLKDGGALSTAPALNIYLRQAFR
jgi:hypothetical protein